MSLVASDVGDAPEASETLGRRSFCGGAFCWFSPQTYSALQQLSKLLWRWRIEVTGWGVVGLLRSAS